MNITVLGLWHLGSVTAACCARHFRVTGLDFDEANVARLREGKAPLYEPGLDELIAEGLSRGSLSFDSDPQSACAGADVLWVCTDTPVDDNDESDVRSVLADIRRAVPHVPRGAVVLVSAQLPVGTCRRLQNQFPQARFACSPENLRLGKAIESFERPARVVAGVGDEESRTLLAGLFAPFTGSIVWMRVESAEMVKHALNAFLALSVTFINEIARLCEHTGADAREVSMGLKSEPRIGAKAYVGPGGAFAGGTLARDVVTLTHLARTYGEAASVIRAIKESNDHHRGWTFERLRSRLGELNGRTVAVLGLTYTPDTDTLRRSAAVELCHQLLIAGAHVRAFDPAVRNLPAELAAVSLVSSVDEALAGADAGAVCTEWPQFREADWTRVVERMKSPLLIDPNAFLQSQLQGLRGVEHVRVGGVA